MHRILKHKNLHRTLLVEGLHTLYGFFLIYLFGPMGFVGFIIFKVTAFLGVLTGLEVYDHIRRRLKHR